ncbi:microcin C ABC transporter permease YejB [Thalassospira sp.]|uniref:microcin C ABC transporter permease YejB n=1 Tax=Thalassospira sp. TaxID=1912094 RepID=UPI000C52708D|nr:microcin C ABC transporter permease YejB [Thalassospira sp.]MBC06825.1 microcin ABC transporter permease [Thalassospira sp.]|tara:strand:- start:1183 stop:2310 length:1128 start_codon:yes stop_codon:yes gene_type:complete
MLNYILRRLLLIPVTLFGIMLLNFVIIQFAPGGPVEQVIAQLQGTDVSATARVTNQGAESGSGGGGGSAASSASGNNFSSTSNYRGAQGLDPEVIKQLEVQFGFDKPAHERFWMMMKNYLTFDFGQSYFQDRDVVDLVLDKMPVSISLGIWSTLIIYIISIPLGITKAVRDGSNFDIWSSAAIIVGFAIPGFLFAVMLIVLFAGGAYLDWFPLRGLTSSNWEQLSLWGKIVDYFWHLALPIIALTISGFATLTMLTKNSFLDEINKQYVVTARAKGLSEKRVLYGHVFRNAMLLIIAGFPSALVGMLFTGSVLIEVIFSLDGLGLLGFNAVMTRDYPVMFATLYFFTLFGLIMNLISDLSYHFVDPRIDFEGRGN